MKTISAVIPTYYRYGPLENTVRDLLQQTVPPKQIIIIDNTSLEDRKRPDYFVSTDQTECLYISSVNQARVNAARNEGLREVTADYAVLFDDDMSLPLDCLENFLKIHAEGWDAVTGVLYEEGVLLKSEKYNVRQPLWDLLRVKHGPYTCHTIGVPSCFISMRMEMLKELGYLDEAYIYNYDDYDLGYRIWRGGYKLIHDKRVTAHHLKLPHGGSRKNLLGKKRQLNKYTAKYYFLAKHFSYRAVRMELIADMLFAFRNNGLNLYRTATDLYLLSKSFREYSKYGSSAKDYQLTIKPKEIEIVET